MNDFRLAARNAIEAGKPFIPRFPSENYLQISRGKISFMFQHSTDWIILALPAGNSFEFAIRNSNLIDLIRKFNGLGSFDFLFNLFDSKFEFDKFNELIHLYPCYKSILVAHIKNQTAQNTSLHFLLAKSYINRNSEFDPTLVRVGCGVCVHRGTMLLSCLNFFTYAFIGPTIVNFLIIVH